MPTKPNRLSLLLVLCGLFAVGATPENKTTQSAPEFKGAASLAELRQRLNEHVSQDKYSAALWGVKVVSLDSGKTLFEHNPQKLLSPASNSKLFTVAFALDRLGPNYRIKTSLYTKAKPDPTGTIEGDLLVYGRGDPSINARVHGGDIQRALRPFVAALTNAGVKRIAGDLVGDHSFFRGPPFGSGWTWDDLDNSFGAEISALSINDNTLQVSVRPGESAGAPCKITLSPATTFLTFSNRTTTVPTGLKQTIHFYRPLNENVVYVTGQLAVDDSVYIEELTLHNPAGLFVALLQEALARAGIQLGGKLRSVDWLDRQVNSLASQQMTELGSVDSLPLRELAKEIMKPSQNLYTDLILAHAGEQSRTSETPAEESSEVLGIRELGKFLGKAGIKRGDLIFEEGSGLSRNNLATPNATVTLLKFMARHPSAELYKEALPVAGEDGTLRTRMKGSPAEGNVRAKTGTLRWANSLSGHVTTAAGERLVFAIMLNRYHANDPSAGRSDVDAIAVMLAGFTGRSDEEQEKR